MTQGRVKRRRAEAALAEAAVPAVAPLACALCGRPIGTRIEWHHAVPKSEGGRETVPVHPICHRTIHATLTNAELAATDGDLAPVREATRGFLRWIADKPADFHAPTRRARR